MGWKIGLTNAVLSGGFFVFLEFLIKRHDRKKANELDPKILKNLMLASGAIIQDRIVQLSRMHIKRGQISVEDKEELWQYTSSGSVDGISGKVDMDKCYVAYWENLKRQ